MNTISRFKEGRRVDFKLDLLKLKSEKMQKVGEWSSEGGLVITDKYAFTEGRPPNITLKVLSRIEEPFVMFRKVLSLSKQSWNNIYQSDCAR